MSPKTQQTDENRRTQEAEVRVGVGSGNKEHLVSHGDNGRPTPVCLLPNRGGSSEIPVYCQHKRQATDRKKEAKGIIVAKVIVSDPASLPRIAQTTKISIRDTTLPNLGVETNQSGAAAHLRRQSGGVGQRIVRQVYVAQSGQDRDTAVMEGQRRAWRGKQVA